MAHEAAERPSDASTEATRAGYVAIVGLPNAGKSSLLNALLGDKLSIVTPLAQTTRDRVVGIDSRDGVQAVYLDTPGLVEPKYLLHRSMLQSALDTVPEADVILVVADAAVAAPSLQDEALTLLQRRASSTLVAANKADIASLEQIQRIRTWADELIHAPTLAVSAQDDTGIDDLRRAIFSRLPLSPFLFPADEISSQPVRFFVAELIRETAFELYQQEVPYSMAVQVDEFLETVHPIRIRATVFVERASQKPIIIGRGGTGIRTLGEQARAKIERFLDTRVHLDLWVKVLPRWRKDATTLRRLGYPVPKAEE